MTSLFISDLLAFGLHFLSFRRAKAKRWGTGLYASDLQEETTALSLSALPPLINDQDISLEDAHQNRFLKPRFLRR